MINIVYVTIYSLAVTSCCNLIKSTLSFQLLSSIETLKFSQKAVDKKIECKQNTASSSPSPSPLSRRKLVSSVPFLLGLQQGIFTGPSISKAAPPFAVIAEELGYFPVTNQKTNQTMYVPARVKRRSSDQAIEFAEYLQSKNTIFYGAFWCPHCQNQKEILGREAFSKIKYVECDGRGYNSGVAICMKEDVSGFPTWKIGKKVISGEMSLEQLAKVSGFKGVIDSSLEKDLPSSRDGVCK